MRPLGILFILISLFIGLLYLAERHTRLRYGGSDDPIRNHEFNEDQRWRVIGGSVLFFTGLVLLNTRKP